MKIVAIILNCIVIVISLMLTMDEWGSIGVVQMLYITVFLVCPVVNILVLSMDSSLKESWLALYFKRKRLEEQQKIDILSMKVKNLKESLRLGENRYLLIQQATIL